MVWEGKGWGMVTGRSSGSCNIRGSVWRGREGIVVETEFEVAVEVEVR